MRDLCLSETQFLPICMYTCLHIHVCIHAYIYMYVYMLTYTCMYTCLHIQNKHGCMFTIMIVTHRSESWGKLYKGLLFFTYVCIHACIYKIMGRNTDCDLQVWVLGKLYKGFLFYTYVCIHKIMGHMCTWKYVHNTVCDLHAGLSLRQIV
jgi:hypothetical protein